MKIRKIPCPTSRIAALILLGGLATTIPSRAMAEGVTLLPITGSGLDSGMRNAIAASVIDKLSSMGYDVSSAASVASATSSHCTDGKCDDPAEAIAVGKAVGSDLVISLDAREDNEEVVLTIIAFDVAAGTNEQAAAKSTVPGMLAKAVKLLALVMPAHAGPDPVPEAAPPSKPAPLPPSTPAQPPTPPEDQIDPEEAQAPIPPGTAVPGATAEGHDGEAAGGPEAGQEEVSGSGKKPGKVAKDQSGRIDLALTSTMYAMLLTFSIMYAAGVGGDEWYWYPPAMLLAGGGALAASLLITWKLKVTSGDAAMYDACLGWGTSNGVLIPLAAGMFDGRSVLVGTVIGGGVGLVGGILAAALFDPSRGDAAFTSALASWGSAYAAMITWLVLPTSPEPYLIATLVGMDAGLVAGIIASIFVEVPPQRIGVITLAGALGGLLGGVVGLPFLLKSKGMGEAELRGYGGMVLGFTTLGIVLGAVLSARLDLKGRKSKGKGKASAESSAMPYLLAHDQGGWSIGIPSISPLTGPEGTSGATALQIGLAGGVF